METRQDNTGKEVLIRCGDAQFAGMNMMRQKKESLLSSCLRTGPALYAVHQRMHLKKFLKQQTEIAIAFNRLLNKKISGNGSLLSAS
jgi:hypothetical protein